MGPRLGADLGLPLEFPHVLPDQVRRMRQVCRQHEGLCLLLLEPQLLGPQLNPIEGRLPVALGHFVDIGEVHAYSFGEGAEG